MKKKTLATIFAIGYVGTVLLFKLAVFCGLIFLAVKILQFMGVI